MQESDRASPRGSVVPLAHCSALPPGRREGTVLDRPPKPRPLHLHRRLAERIPDRRPERDALAVDGPVVGKRDRLAFGFPLEDEACGRRNGEPDRGTCLRREGQDVGLFCSDLGFGVRRRCVRGSGPSMHTPALIQAPPVRYILVPSERGVLSWAAAAIGVGAAGT